MNERAPDLTDLRARRGARCDVLLLEADEPYRITIEACVQLVGGRVEAVACLEAALSALERQHYDLVVWGVSKDVGLGGGAQGRYLSLPCRLLSQHGQGYCLLFSPRTGRQAEGST